MSAIPKNRKYTFEDFCFLVKDGQKADLIDGVIYIASPENLDSNDLTVWMTRLYGDFIEETDQGALWISRVAFRLSDFESPEPDLAFVKKARLFRRKRGHFAGAPDLGVEIVSPDSIERDYTKKRKQYEDAGMSEYWIIDELQQKVTLLRLGKDGKYHEVRLRKGELHSEVLRGFWLRPEWLWQKPLPRKKDVLHQLLARLEPPAKS
jgi:Uma2 family endonuclease